MSSGVKIRYGDVAPEAKENFVPSATDKESFVDLAQLQKYNLEFRNYANPCEYGSVLLDGNSVPFPDSPQSQNMGLWSKSLSGADGSFAEPIEITLTADGQYSSQGITLTFDTYNDIFCNSLKIEWYRNDEQLESVNFQPNSPFYFCRKQVQNYDKVVITFNSLNMPHNRLKLRAIDYGYGTFLGRDELRNVSVIQEIDPISSEIAINTVDFVLDSKSDMEYSFQSKQPLSVYFNDNLIATTFVKSSKRKSKRQWEVNSEDYIGQLDKITFMGGMYKDKNITELLSDMLTQAKVPYSIDESLSDKTVTGYVPICTCREALMQMCFAVGAVADTSNSAVLKVYVLSDSITQTVPLSRIRQGQNFDDGERVTEVRVISHNYAETDEQAELYRAADSGTGEGILVRFSEPMHTLSIRSGTVLSSGANYALIDANAGCKLVGKKYADNSVTVSKKNPVVSASDIENVTEISNATLVSSDNADEVIERCYDYLVKTNKVNLSVVETKTDTAINAGDTIAANTEYLGVVTGQVISVRYNLNGGIIVKECVMV